MKLVIFGLAISSSWGNGHAALWRGLVRALADDGHTVIFYERDVPYYAQTRDLHELALPCALVLYREWREVSGRAARDIADADVAMVTSYCPDAGPAADLVRDAGRALRCFYDLDTPVTLAALSRGERVAYVPQNGFADFDLVLSYTGGAALDALRDRLGARRAVPLYGSVDVRAYGPAAPDPNYQSCLSYLGTYAADRQAALERLFVAPARARPDARFVLGGAMYPADFPWTANIWFVRHVPPPAHPSFYAASALTLNVTRAAMAAMGWCPSGRLFEAAACGAAILTDRWDGLDSFYTPDEEILLAETTEDALAALDLGPEALAAIGRRARARTLEEHSAARRARQMLDAFARTDASAEAC